jgi:hypothetical protein
MTALAARASQPAGRPLFQAAAAQRASIASILS